MIPVVTPEDMRAKLEMVGIQVDIGIQHHFGAGVYIRQMKLDAGHFAITHAHAYDHFSLLGSGIATLETDGVCSEHRGPCVLTIKADTHHRIVAKTDITWFCIHATDETEPDMAIQLMKEK